MSGVPPPLAATPPREAIESLCERLGIAARWHDFYGALRDVPDTVLLAALDAVGHPARTPEELARSQAALQAGDAPAAQILREGEPLRIAIGAHGPAPLGIVQCEDGSVLRARLDEADGVRALQFDALPPGYHQLRISAAGGGVDAQQPPRELIVCPMRGWQPEALATGSRWWGVCVQLYALRSPQNWGVGDFSDLARLAETMAAHGAAFVGLNPLHALFPSRPEDASPYSPSSRLALNPLYLDVEALPDFHACRDARQQADRESTRRRIEALRETDEVDWPGVAALKLPLLERLWEHFRDHEIAAGSPRAAAFRAFMGAHPHLARHALFEAIQEHLRASDAGVWGWPAWPEAWRDPDGAEVRRFAAASEDRIGLHAWLQWQADQQLAAAQARARAAGMPLGLYRDLAVGANEGGSDVWSAQAAHALGLHVGAPPDPLALNGQDWGLPPPDPARMADDGYAGFVRLLRANMRHAGALRIDHVMALMRLFWVHPEGGTYVRYPLADLMAILVLESRRQQCLVIGEDLGNVAPEMRESMQAHGLLSYCPLYFERDAAGDFRAPDQWRAQALAVVGTHDLPTLAGWWQGEDIELAARLAREGDPGENAAFHGRQVIERAQARAQLLIALEREGLLPEGTSVHPTSMPGAGPRLVEAVHAFLARTPCLLLGVQIEDVTGQLHAVNVPGTLESQHPNWRRKLGIAVDDLAVDARMLGVARVLAGRAAAAVPGEAAPPPAAGEVPDIAGAEVPASTYRVQLHAGFGFDAAARAVPYLAALGVSHLYVSPWQRARAGSTHGYDVVDHDALNPELGDEAAFERLCQALAAHGMRQMLDIVPNHMGVLEADNAWWLDVLEHGPASLQAETFDIDWSPSDPQMQGRVLLPVLGDHYGRVLEAGELKLVFDADEGSFHVAYWNHRFPIDPRDYPALLGRLPLPGGLPEEERARIESVLHALAQLPPRSDTSADARATRARDARVHKRTLARRVAAQPLLAAWIDAAVQSYGGTPGEAASFDALDTLIARQAWRLAYWRVAGDEINYRRFFDINTLAALRTEREPVFEATHRRVLRWLQDGCVHALRIDHPDGLADPRGYFARLQARQAQACERAGLPRHALYLVVEKILADHEDLPADWPVHGGTGYRFSNLVNGLFVDAAGEGQLTRVYADFIGERLDFGDVLYDAKRLIMDVALASDLQWLAEALLRISRADRRTCDFTRAGLRLALAEVAAGFSVYRTYLTGDGQASETDRRYLDQAIARARRRGVAGDVSVLQHLRHVLLAPPGEGAAHDSDYEAARRAFIARWQQFTAPVMAKAMEDTAFYRYHRLVSLNDVGGDPRTFGTPPKAFHAVCESQAAERPNWLLGSSTHDSKRSEDVRTRLDVLAEMPAEWAAAVHEWRTLADAFAGSVAGLRAPTRNDEYLLYQTLVGVWPLVPTDEAVRQDLRERVGAYMLKAMREAKQETSWINPDDDYEAAMAGFIDGLFASREFVASLEAFVARIAPAGLANSLNLVMLKFMAPGVPDVYQGCEGWNFSLVDPDNRRPVDFEGAAARLAVVRGLYGQRDASTLATAAVPARGDWEVLRARPDDGRLKQLVTWRLLQLRAAQPGFFARAGYSALAARGSRADHVLAFARTATQDTQDGSTPPPCVVAVASRLPWRRLGGEAAAEALSGGAGWDDTTLRLPAAPGGWRELFTGRAIAGADAAHALGDLLSELPLAVLVPIAWWPHDPSPASKVIP